MNSAGLKSAQDDPFPAEMRPRVRSRETLQIRPYIFR
jgi:hypothetical protein